MKRNAFFLFAAVLLAGSFHIWTSRVLADAPVEDGTAASPWLIHSADELRGVSEKPGDYFRLAENVEAFVETVVIMGFLCRKKTPHEDAVPPPGGTEMLSLAGVR